MSFFQQLFQKIISSIQEPAPVENHPLERKILAIFLNHVVILPIDKLNSQAIDVTGECLQIKVFNDATTSEPDTTKLFEYKILFSSVNHVKTVNNLFIMNVANLREVKPLPLGSGFVNFNFLERKDEINYYHQVCIYCDNYTPLITSIDQ